MNEKKNKNKYEKRLTFQQKMITRQSEQIEKLKFEIERIKASAAEDDEQDYICKCLDEVMVEMGYNVIGSKQVTKKSGKRLKSELYNCGEITAVNVTYSSDGKIAMEIGGLDEKDRLPDEEEISALCTAMEKFCEEFKEIERRLMKKGVVLSSRISIQPPTKENAQIINTSDYNMTEETPKKETENKTQKVKKPKTMKME